MTHKRNMNESFPPHTVCFDLRSGHARPAEIPPAHTVLCLGNFDGVHLAHAALLREGIRLSHTLSAARGEAVACGVLCFFRPSSDAFRPADAPPHHLTTLGQKLALFAEIGVEYAFLCEFEEVRSLSHEIFLSLLETRLGCVGAVCGFNHRFGAKARGDASHLLRQFGESSVVLMPEMTVDGVTVSSSAIRDRLWKGDAEGAARLLGRPYRLTATVTHGKHLGRTWGFPTANQSFLRESLVPAHGVYVALCHTDRGVFPAVANVGIRPTVEQDARVNCESHMLGFTGDLYGQRMRTDLIAYLRPERRFASADALQAAIAADAASALAYLQDHHLLP